MGLGYTKLVLIFSGLFAILAGVSGVAAAFRGSPVTGLITVLLALAVLWATIREWPVVSACGTAADIARSRGVNI